MTSSASVFVEGFVGDGPDVGGPLHRKVLGVSYCLQCSSPGPAGLPVGCPSPDGLRPPHGLPLCLIEKWFGNSATYLSLVKDG